jgi:hypothetical protein
MPIIPSCDVGGPASRMEFRGIVARMRTREQRRLIFIIGFAIYFVLIWALWPTLAVYPLKIFVVFLHELSHAFAGALTGGHVDRITLNARQGGATYVSGGNAFVMLSAGYLGSLLWGLLLLLAAQSRPKRARAVLGALACVLLVATVLFVRSGFGFLFGILFGFALLVASRRLSNGGIVVVLTVLGMTSALYALLDIRDDIIMRPGVESDAHMLAQMTHIPTIVWGVLWAGIAVAACWLLLRRLYERA